MYAFYLMRNYLQWRYFYFSVLIYFAESVKLARNRLSDSILHYEPVEYSKDFLISRHLRIRKSIGANDQELQLDFKAHDRRFNLRLKRDTNLFTHNLHIEDAKEFHPSNIYEGYIQDEPLSSVHGFIYDGIFEGSIHTEDRNEFHIESVKQYKHLNNTTIHSVIYNVKDIFHQGPYHCGGVKASTKFKSNENQTGITWNNFEGTANKGKITFHRQRRFANNGKQPQTECHLYVRADPTYTKYAIDDNRAMYKMSQHVKRVSYIFKATDFDDDPNETPDEYTLHIKRIGVIDTSRCRDTGDNISPDCRFKADNIGVEKFLDIASLEDHNQYCLSYIFAHRDFSDGVLGLAWIGDVDGAGGICDGYQSIGGIMKSLNTGIVSNLNYGKGVPSKVTDVTLAHEIGHNFGSQHDPLSGKCAPGGSGGNYIMYPRATSGSERNNNKFSECSKKSIMKVLIAKADRCFKEKGEPICGNRVVEDGEKCDCGYHTEPSCEADKCCIGASENGGSGGCEYTEKAKKVGSNRCSSSQGFCCNATECKPYANSTKKECSKLGECAEASMCIDKTHICPKAAFKANKTVCNTNSNTCVDGECSGSLCLIINKKDCQCLEKDAYCNVCCQDKSAKGLSNCTLYLNNKKRVVRPAGSPCDQYQGYCDILFKCRNVDAEGPLSRLKKWLLSPKSFHTILDWMKTHWWACVLIGLGLVLFMAGFIACCSVHTPSSNPAKPQHRTLTQSLSRRTRAARPTAPTPSSSSGGYPDLPPGYDTAVRESRHIEHEMR